jgi:predicted O-methyltransferase YrrM
MKTKSKVTLIVGIISNALLNNDERIETVLLPIRDGLTISRVK